MANNCKVMFRGILCRGYRRCLCVLLLCMLGSLSSVLSISTEEKTLSIYPTKDKYVNYGDDAEIFCVAGQNYTYKDLAFKEDGALLPSIKINSTTIKYVLKHPEITLHRNIMCLNNKSGRNEMVTVIVGSPPANVTDFECISKNLDSMNCSWTTPDQICTNYTVAYVNHGQKTKECNAKLVDYSLTRYCIWDLSTTPLYRQQLERYNFTLQAENQFGKNKQLFSIAHYEIVKPNPPESLINTSTSAHSVMLQWKLHYNIVDFLIGGVETKIEYQIAKIDDTSYFRRVNTTGLPACSSTYNFNLTDLPYAHMKYGVRVYIKPVHATDKYWSDFNNIVVYTASEAPHRPPDTIAGAFRQNTFKNYRVVYIYWKQLEEYEESGANFTYKIIVKRDSKADTYFSDDTRRMGYLVLDNTTLNAMDIFISSYNEIGSSVNSSYLYIPDAATCNLSVNSFSKLAYENGTYELSWQGVKAVDNYTLFWCQHNVTDICNGRMDFKVLSPTDVKHVIDLPRNNRYQFAISANKGLTSSGMTWALCHISKEEIAMFRFPIEFSDQDAPGKSFVKLQWSMECILKEGIILGFNISYCPVIQTSSICEENSRNLYQYIADPEQLYTTIENLEPYKTYQFTMTLNTTLGEKRIENNTVRITTLEDTPTSPRNVEITNLGNSSLTISWDRPEHLNGHVSKISYVIYNFSTPIEEVKYNDKMLDVIRIDKNLTKLNAFTNFSLTIKAYNDGIRSYSMATEPIRFRNCLGAPSKMNPPTDKADILTWEPPQYYGGPEVDLYQIRITRDDQIQQTDIINTTLLFHNLQQCQGLVKKESYEVRAVTFDEDMNHGASSDSDKVTLPIRSKEIEGKRLFYPGEWSNPYNVVCNRGNGLYLVFIIMGLLFVIAVVCGALKVYKKVRRMKDIKPEFPKGLFIAPEKDVNKYPFTGLYPPNKDEKATSDEMLLLPNNKSASTPPEIKKDNDNCGSSDHTDSTALSDASNGAIDRQNSTSDDDSHSSLHFEIEPIKATNSIEQATDSTSDAGSSHEHTPYFGESAFKKNKLTGYVQSLQNPPPAGYIQSALDPFKSCDQQMAGSQPTSSSYVMAGMPPPAFAHCVPPHPVATLAPTSSGYVRAEDALPRPAMNFPTLGPSPTKAFGSESLPTMPDLPPSTKYGANSSYIQLQSLDPLASQKLNVRNPVLMKPPASIGYVSPEDAVINKHLKNIMSGGQMSEESAILDPTMSPDAYCRFSWSTDPSNDNLHMLLGNSSTIKPSKN